MVSRDQIGLVSTEEKYSLPVDYVSLVLSMVAASDIPPKRRMEDEPLIY